MILQHIAVVIPVLNEEAVLDVLVEQLLFVLEGKDLCWSVLFVE